MQLFNREPTTASIALKYNCANGTGNEKRNIATIDFTCPDCLFIAVTTYNQPSSYASGIMLYFITNRTLAQSEIAFIIHEYSSTTGYSVDVSRSLGSNPITRFSNNMTDTGSFRSALLSADIAKANATATEITLYAYEMNLSSGVMASYAYGMPAQNDFALSVEGVPCVLLDSNYRGLDNLWNNQCNGEYLNGNLILTGFYSPSDAWDSFVSSGVYGGTAYNYYGRALIGWLWAVANGDLDTDIDVETPFNPLPTDFYITVNCQTDGADKGEQSLTFRWTPQNIEELDVDLENVSLHFAFTMSPSYTYTNVVPYSSESYATSYKSLCEEMAVPWWRNIINKLPLPSQEINTTINCDIWWSTPAGNAGVCQYIIKYDGTNIIGTERAKDPTTDLWTYLTANEGTDSQDYDPDPNPYDDLTDFGGGTDAVNGSALLTTSYGLSVAGAHSFGTWLWGTGLDLDQLKMVVNNPIENIVACKLFPFSVTGTASTVKLGNVSSPVSAYLLPENVARTFDAGDVTIPKKYNSFLDYAPYTNVRIYLPYLGLHEIETDVVMGATINVKYYVDLVTGHCRAIIFLKDGASLKKIQQIDGMMGQDVPVIGSNRAQVEAGYIVGGAQAVASFAGGIGNAIMGNVGAGLADIGSAIKGGLQTAMQQYHTYTNGTPSPALSRFDEQKVCVFVDRPVYTKPSKFDHQNGKMCNLTCALNELEGYTVIDNTVDLSSIPCSKYERDELLKLLTSGVYL